MKNVAERSVVITPPSGIFPVYDAANPDRPVLVVEHRLKSIEVALTAIKVGEQGRGRWESALLVSGIEPGGELRAAGIGETRSGSCKLLASNRPCVGSTHAIVVCQWGTGYRGGNSYTGERLRMVNDQGEFAPMPGIVLAEGTIADGAAGNMSNGQQRVICLPAGEILRLAQSGRRAAKSLYVWFSGERLYVRTWEERIAACEIDGDPFPVPAKEAL